MLPIDLGIQMQDALEDEVITVSELGEMTSYAVEGAISTAISGMIMVFAMTAFYKVIGESSNPGNPGNPSTHDIIARAGLKEYEEKWFPMPEEERKPRVYVYVRTKDIGIYHIRMTRTNDTCMIKLYENLPGWKRKLRATWSGIGKPECDAKFEKVCEVVRETRFEEKTAIMRR